MGGRRLPATHQRAPSAVLYNLLILGEAVKALGEETKARRPESPWRQIAGLRDLLAHEYYRIDMTEIDRVIKRDLAPLARLSPHFVVDRGDEGKREPRGDGAED